MKTTDLLKQIITDKQISEKEILLLKRRKNNGEKFSEELFWNNEIKLTSDQIKKGLDFLMNLWKTPKNIERKNNPFGYREQNVLDSLNTITFNGFYDAGNAYHSYYLPIYTCHSRDNSFQYYYNGKVNVIG